MLHQNKVEWFSFPYCSCICPCIFRVLFDCKFYSKTRKFFSILLLGLVQGSVLNWYAFLFKFRSSSKKASLALHSWLTPSSYQRMWNFWDKILTWRPSKAWSPQSKIQLLLLPRQSPANHHWSSLSQTAMLNHGC